MTRLERTRSIAEPRRNRAGTAWGIPYEQRRCLPREGRSVGVRDSECPGDGALVFGADEWIVFTAAVRDGSLG
ncbi:DUF397 domain-containing protein [Nocardia acidivorans]|uniref:DUF397 domain-containing protein n=1 Tax=Nocardia acidivorans TaxID=404580 RepID=UPI0035A249EB